MPTDKEMLDEDVTKCRNGDYMEHIEENHAHPIGDHFDNSSQNCRNHCEEKHPETALQIIP